MRNKAFFLSFVVAFGFLWGDMVHAQSIEPISPMEKPTVENLEAQIKTLLEQIGNLEKQLGHLEPSKTLIFSVPELTKNFSLGATDKSTQGEVTKLQDFLILENKGPAAKKLGDVFLSGVKNGYFGLLTGLALQEWQKTQNISPTFPKVGPKTRAALDVLRAKNIVVPIDENNDGVFLVSPVSGEEWISGKDYSVQWKYDPSRPRLAHEPAFAIISFVDGPKNGTLAMVGGESLIGHQITFTFDKIIQGDVALLPEPGEYRVELQLYDREFCIGLCPPLPSGTAPVLLGEDISDGKISVVSPKNSVSIPGVADCLPPKGPGPHPAICAIGLKTANGFYAVKNVVSGSSLLSYGQKNIMVSGVLSEEPMSGYDIIGIIDKAIIVQISS